MTDPDEYRNNRAMYEADTKAMVKCVTCGEMVPEDEVFLYRGIFQCDECAIQSGLRRCYYCGEWDVLVHLTFHADDANWYHPQCLKEMQDEMARRER